MVDARGPADALGLVGSTIDQVRFDACVDAGGFGLIYRGYHQGLGETVAIKCLRIAAIQRTNEAIREALAGRFRDETKLLYRLSQGNLDIVRCIGSGNLVAPTTHEYTPYMILEWLDGCTLSAELKERRLRGYGARTLDEAVSLLDSAVGALAYAHTHDVVHRDVKPGNLFLTRTREGVRMKVLDFGLAKILSDEAIGVRPSVETGVGVHFCSPSYGAPEQFSGQAGKIGPWTDVYSLALVLLEVMTGEKVRPAGTLAEGLLKAIDPVTGSPSASKLGLHVSRAVEDVLLRAVAQEPLQRPHDAGVFWALLKDAIVPSTQRDLGATVADNGVNEAMQQVRAATTAQGTAQPSPFAGTMLMQNAPSGAPHLVAPLPAAGRAPPEGRPPEALPGGAQGVSRGTSPLSPPLASLGKAAPGSVPPPPGPGSMRDARARGERLKGTMPIGAMSPLASSVPVQPPLRSPTPGNPMAAARQAPQSGPPPAYGAPAQAMSPPERRPSNYPTDPRGAPADPRRNTTTDPRLDLTPVLPMKSKMLGVVVLLVTLVLVGAGLAFYWLRLRGH